MVKFDNGLQVVSEARKLIFKVPASTEKAEFPDGAVISEYGQNNDSPVIVVLNATDSGGTWQGADGENGVVILNEVPGDVANQLLDMVRAGFDVAQLSTILEKASELGCGDQYTTDTGFVDKRLTPAGRVLDQYTGVVKRDDRDVCLIVRDENGVIWRKLGDGDPKHIEEDILLRTYVKADGSPIDLEEIPSVQTS